MLEAAARVGRFNARRLTRAFPLADPIDACLRLGERGAKYDMIANAGVSLARSPGIHIGADT